MKKNSNHIENFQSTQAIDSDPDSNSNSNSIFNTPKVSKKHKLPKNKLRQKTGSIDQENIEKEFFSFLQQQDKTQQKKSQINSKNNVNSSENPSKQRVSVMFQQRQEIQRQRNMEQKQIEGLTKENDYMEIYRKAKEQNNKPKEAKKEEISDLDQFAIMQKQIVEDMNKETQKKENFIIKAKIKDINKDVNLTEEQKRVKIQMLVNKKEKAVRVQHLLKQQQQKVQRNVALSKEEKFDKNMKIFQNLDTYLETKDLIKNMNDLNKDEQQKIKEEYTKLKMEKVLGNYKKELAILLEQRPEEEREDFQNDFLSKLELLDRAQTALKEKKSLLQKGDKVTQQFVSKLQEEILQEPDNLQDVPSDSNFFFTKLEKDLNSGIFMKDIINETEHENGGNDNQWQLEMLKNQLSKYQQKAPVDGDESEEKLQKFQKKAQKVIGLLVKTSKNIFRKKIKTTYDEAQTVEFQRQRLREKKNEQMKENYLKKRQEQNGRITETSIEEEDTEQSMEKSKQSIVTMKKSKSSQHKKPQQPQQPQQQQHLISLQDQHYEQPGSHFTLDPIDDDTDSKQTDENQTLHINLNQNNSIDFGENQLASAINRQDQDDSTFQNQVQQEYLTLLQGRNSPMKQKLFHNITSQLNISQINQQQTSKDKDSRKVALKTRNSQDISSNQLKTSKKYHNQKSRYLNDSFPQTAREYSSLLDETLKDADTTFSTKEVLQSIGLKPGMSQSQIKQQISTQNISDEHVYQIDYIQRKQKKQQQKQNTKRSQKSTEYSLKQKKRLSQNSLLDSNINQKNNSLSHISFQQPETNNQNKSYQELHSKLPKIPSKPTINIINSCNNFPRKSEYGDITSRNKSENHQPIQRSGSRYSVLSNYSNHALQDFHQQHQQQQFLQPESMVNKQRMSRMSKMVKKQYQQMDELIVQIGEEKKQYRSEKQALFKEIDQLAEKQEKAMEKFKPPQLESLRFIDKSENHNDMFKANRKINLKTMKLAL